MEWKSNRLACSRAHNEWELADRDIREFLRFGLLTANEEYDATWNAAASEPSDGSADVDEVFHHRVDGLWLYDFEWMLLSSALRDSVTGFEVYLDKALEEVLSRHGLTLRHFTDTNSLAWDELRKYYKRTLGLKIENSAVKVTRKLRHILVHKRGELRTVDQRSEFSDPGWPIGRDAHLTVDVVTEHLDVLAERTAYVDPVVFASVFGGAVPEQLATFLAEHG